MRLARTASIREVLAVMLCVAFPPLRARDGGSGRLQLLPDVRGLQRYGEAVDWTEEGADTFMLG